MNPEALDLGIEVLALALTIGSFVLLFNGGALPLGTSFRSTIEPLLSSIRSTTSLSRPELADVTVIVAIGFAFFAAIFEAPVGGIIMMGLLAWARPLIRRATKDEHKLMALAGSFSIDLVIGLYVPMVLAQLLLRHFFTAITMLLVVVALSWPAGGGLRSHGRGWRLAPVSTR